MKKIEIFSHISSKVILMTFENGIFLLWKYYLEDDIALNKSICAALNYSGYDVDTFFDGNEVLNHI